MYMELRIVKWESHIRLSEPDEEASRLFSDRGS